MHILYLHKLLTPGTDASGMPDLPQIRISLLKGKSEPFAFVPHTIWTDISCSHPIVQGTIVKTFDSCIQAAVRPLNNFYFLSLLNYIRTYKTRAWMCAHTPVRNPKRSLKQDVFRFIFRCRYSLISFREYS